MTREEIMLLDADAIEMRVAELAELIKTAESNEDLDSYEAELEAIEERKSAIREEMETRKKSISEIVKGAGVPIEGKAEEGEPMEVRNSKEYINAYANYIKTGSDAECRALLTENVSGGTVPIPDFVYDIVKTAWEREGVMALVRKTYMRGNLKVGFEISADGAVVHTEGGDAISPENLVLGVVELVPQSIKKVVQISDEVYDMRGEEFLRYIYDELTYRIAKKGADIIIASIIACGTVSTTGSPGVPTIKATQISVGLVAQAMANLSDEASNPVVIMNKQTWGAFKAAQYAGSFEVDPFEGLPVIFNNSITAFSAATSGVTYAIVGDLGQGAMANFPNGDGIEFKFDDMTLKKQDLIEVLGRQYVGLGVVAPDAFVKITH